MPSYYMSTEISLNGKSLWFPFVDLYFKILLHFLSHRYAVTDHISYKLAGLYFLGNQPNLILRS